MTEHRAQAERHGQKKAVARTAGPLVVLLTVVTVVTLVGAVLTLSGVARAGNAESRELSQLERARLAAGDLVRRPMTQQRGSLQLMGGTSYQVIDAPTKVVWSALLDTEHYSRMLPQVLEARVVRQGEHDRTIYVRQGAGMIAKQYYLKISVYQERGDITFNMDDRRPHDLRAAWGFYTVRPYADGNKTLLAYGVMADIGVGIFGALVRDDVHDWMLKVPSTVKRFVEGSGRWLYRAARLPAVARANPPRG